MLGALASLIAYKVAFRVLPASAQNL